MTLSEILQGCAILMLYSPMPRLKKILHIALAVILIAIGIAGLVLPILDGIIFLLLGFILLSFESPLIEVRLSTIAKKNRYIDAWYEKLNIWMRKFFGE